MNKQRVNSRSIFKKVTCEKLCPNKSSNQTRTFSYKLKSTLLGQSILVNGLEVSDTVKVRFTFQTVLRMKVNGILGKLMAEVLLNQIKGITTKVTGIPT